jgi:hypothetical protein
VSSFGALLRTLAERLGIAIVLRQGAATHAQAMDLRLLPLDGQGPGDSSFSPCAIAGRWYASGEPVLTTGRAISSLWSPTTDAATDRQSDWPDASAAARGHRAGTRKDRARSAAPSAPGSSPRRRAYPRAGYRRTASCCARSRSAGSGSELSIDFKNVSIRVSEEQGAMPE